MFVPLEPSATTQDLSTGLFMETRCDVASSNYPPAMHYSSAVASFAMTSHVTVPAESVSTHWTMSSNGPRSEEAFTAVGSTLSQVDATLQTVSPPDDLFSVIAAPSEADGVFIEPILRAEAAHSLVRGPHLTSVTPDKPTTAALKRKARPRLSPEMEIQGPVSHSAAPLHVIEPALDPALRSPTDKFSLLQTIDKRDAVRGEPAAWSWNQGLVESSRRRDWIWPKIVDELIGRQWVAVDQLGRTALGNAREETRRILVTSTRRGEGRTTIALALARWSAMTGNRTLLVDADKNHPGVAPALHIQATGDWRKSSLAFGVENSLVTCRSLPLSLLPLSPDPSLATSSVTLEQLIVQLAVAEQEFDLCVIDGSPIAELCEQISIVTRLASSIVVVNDDKHGAPQSLISACNLLWQRGKPAMAIADNFRR